VNPLSPLALLLWILVLFVVWQVFLRLVRRIRRFPAPAFMGRLLDSGYRRRIQPPDLLLDRSGIVPGMTVLEVGCGSGCYTTFAARRVGPAGRVVGFDIQRGMLIQCARKLARPEWREIRNLDLVRGDARCLPFRDGVFDAVYLVTVLQEIPDTQAALSGCRRVLRAGGVLGVTELLADPDYPLKRTTIRLGQEAGFALDAAEGGLWNYTVRFRKP
jgi:ubiquinone/menaquinone biosynthesis C-methylase UbiE